MYGLIARRRKNEQRKLLEFMQLSDAGENADCRLFAWYAEKTGAGRGGDSWPRILFLDEPFEGVGMRWRAGR